MEEKSLLETYRLKYKPHLPPFLKEFPFIEFVEKREVSSETQEKLKQHFPNTLGQPILKLISSKKKPAPAPLKVGVVLSGGQAPGGHNVIIGLYDALKKIHENGRLLGFLNGPSGIIENKYEEMTDLILNDYRNTGGFDLIGSGRTKIETGEQLEASWKNCESLGLDGLVIIGGDDSNTNAAILAEYFISKGCKTCVVGVPKTIDGDLKNTWVEASFGFDTASKTYSELIGNIARDCLSAKKYFHFIKLMGRSASHITLECALQTRVNLAIIGEEAHEKKLSVHVIVNEIADLVCDRSNIGKNYGVVLIPEGLIEFVDEMKALIKELNALLVNEGEKAAFKLSSSAKKTFDFLPKKIQEQLLLDRDPHGNVQVSHIDTQELFIEKVKEELKKRQKNVKFSPISHFFGYEGRSGFPSNFDANYCYALGFVSAALISQRKTGYMSSIQGLTHFSDKWEAAGLPITMMMHLEERKGKEKPVIQKALVDLKGEPFKFFSLNREKWRLEDHYRYPGPIQLFGPENLCDEPTITLKLEQTKKIKVGASI